MASVARHEPERKPAEYPGGEYLVWTRYGDGWRWAEFRTEEEALAYTLGVGPSIVTRTIAEVTL